uniref:Ribosomal RNA-processing protein 42 n=1 Tax=Babesia bovis TaxID=5865 RepID=S6BH91_BABBO|nr:conserved hypothetical protein [Babesia bovis]
MFHVTSPNTNTPEEGNVEITLGSPFTLEDSDISQKRDERMAHILEMLQFHKPIFNRKLLCILSGQYVWTMRIHTTVLQRGGGVMDAVSVAVICAMLTVSVPNIRGVIKDELESSRTATNVRLRTMEGYNTDIEKLAREIPVLVTVARIGESHVWSVNQEEAACADGFLTVAVFPNGHCAGIRAVGASFPLSVIPSLIAKARTIGLYQHQQITTAL